MAFSDNLKTLRMKAGITQDKLATELQISLRTIASYELGKSLPSFELIPRIAKFFGVTIDSIMTEQEEFVAQAYEQNGIKGAKQAAALIDGVVGLFAGGELSEDDKDATMRALQNAYWIAKDESKKKYTPIKYRKTEE